MPVSRDLQAPINRLDVAIAAGDTYGRVDLDRLRRELTAIRDQSIVEEAASLRKQRVLDELIEAVEHRAADLRMSAHTARRRSAEPAKLVSVG
jgi:soluble P-type ATPase